MTLTAGLLVAWAATESPSPSPSPKPMREIDPATVTPGLLGLFFFVALFVAVFFLMRSFSRQLRKIDIPEGGVPIERRRDRAGEGPDSEAAGEGAGTDAAGTRE